MKKQFLICSLALILMLLLAGCGCEHNWTAATCQAPATCSECGKTEGEIGDHLWQEATCQAPQTCSICNTFTGTRLSHQWVNDPCIITCSLCNYESTSSPGHQWQDATCTSPKKCSTCSASEGEALGHNWIEAACNTAKHCSVCKEEEGEPLGHVLTGDGNGSAEICSVCKKAVEYFSDYAYTEYDIALDNSYTNPVTILKGWSGDSVIQWVKDGVVQGWCSTDLSNHGSHVTAYYADGKVFYYDGGASGEATAKHLARIAGRYVSAVYFNYGTDGNYVSLTTSDFLDVKGEAAAACDINGTQYVIVNKLGSWDSPYDPANTVAVQSNWKNG